jgi:aspartate aminotransferase
MGRIMDDPNGITGPRRLHNRRDLDAAVDVDEGGELARSDESGYIGPSEECDMSISRIIQESMLNSSWIRRMFEHGQTLSARYGASNVFDFSIGSPHLEPPDAVQRALVELTSHPRLGMHRYMPNNGFASTREAVARHLGAQERAELTAEDVIMTVGAAGAINVALKSVLDPGEEVIILAPYFAEYLFYIGNHCGVPRVVETTPDFDLDVQAVTAAFSEKTKAIILNTPNNPTGRIYSAAKMAELAAALRAHEQKLGHEIYLLIDTPYAQLVYDGHANPALLEDHPSTLIAHSYSKELGLAGERIGYLAISPRAPQREALRGACTFAVRTLGYVNAPALMQLALERSMDATVDVSVYRKLRDRLCDGLRRAGYEFHKPQGAFYLFPKSPIPDDLAFTDELLKENVLVVPGRGFGRPGYLRIAYCVSEKVIDGALPRFAKVIERVRGTSGTTAAQP